MGGDPDHVPGPEGVTLPELVRGLSREGLRVKPAGGGGLVGVSGGERFDLRGGGGQFRVTVLA